MSAALHPVVDRGTAQPHVAADRGAIARFVALLFPYADPDSYVSLRVLPHRRGVPPLQTKAVQVGEDLTALIDTAGRTADWTARQAHREPAVFAPPVATFSIPDSAGEQDVANGVALSVELDSGDTDATRRRLESLLDPATVVMASGGEWSESPVKNAVFKHPRTAADGPDLSGSRPRAG